MRKFNWLLGMLLLALVPMLQSCDNDEDYTITGWDWATVHTTGGGSYYLEGDQSGAIHPVTSSIPWFRPVDGERVVAFFNPLEDMDGRKGLQVNLEGVQDVLTKSVEEMTAENEKEFGNDPIVIFEEDMWLGGKFLNIIFCQNRPHSEKHRISLVENKIIAPTPMEEDGYIHLELRYNTYKDLTNDWVWGRVSYNLEKYYPSAEKASESSLKGFKVKINSDKNGPRVLVLDFDHPVAVPDKAKDAHSTYSIR